MKKPFITVTHGMSGWFAVLMAWYKEDAMWDVVTTGIGRYENKVDAEEEGKEWAKAEELEFK
jgi:hypothetical protein